MTGAAATDPVEGRDGRRLPRVAALGAAVLAVAHFASFDIADQALITDVRYYVYLAWQVTEGVPPHVSTFDPKTQLATFAGALFFALGEVVGAEPLIAMRVGFLGIAALGGWFAFLVHRRLGGGSGLVGLVGILAYCSFGLIGALPAIGPIPKLGMAVATTGAALLVHRRRWVAAGAVATIGFLDWQIGALTCAATFGSALLFGSPRLAAALRVLAGGALAAVPYTLYFAVHGALAAAWNQTIVAAFFRGTSAMQRRSFGEHLEFVHQLVRRDTPEQTALAWVALLGIPVAVGLAWRWRRDDRLRLLVPLLAVNLGIVGFTLIDFQGHGDVNALAHALAFFLALAAGSAVAALGRRMPARRAAQSAFAAAVLVAATAAARPSFLRPDLPIGTKVSPSSITLADQRDVAARVSALVGDRTLAVLEHSELLYFLRYTNPVPTIYWNVAALANFRRSPEESEEAVVARLLKECSPDALLFFAPHRRDRFPAPWRSEEVTSESGRYTVRLELFDR